MESVQALRHSPSVNAPLSSPFSVVKTNIYTIESAKVIVFLVNHKKPLQLETIEKHFSTLTLDHSVLLVEDDKDIPRMSSHLSTKCWERMDLQAKMLEEKKPLLAVQDALKNFWNPDYCADLKVQQIQVLYDRIKVLKPDEDFTDCERVYTCLRSGELSKDVLGTDFNMFLDWFKAVRQEFMKQTIESHFGERQTSLIDSIQENLDQDQVFAICGRRHGAICNSSLDPEVERLYQSLEQVPFVILDIV